MTRGAGVGIRPRVLAWIADHAGSLRGRTVLDLPAGNGVSSRALRDAGAEVLAFDLLPGLFRVDGLACRFADLAQPLPLPDASVDCVLCQEGLEHVPDQAFALAEFSRVLRPGGRLIVTTPNYSNLRSRASYLLCESEYFGKILPPNERDSLWLTAGDSGGLYYGHAFLVGFFKLRLWYTLAGFELVRLHPTGLNRTSLVLFPLLYPWIAAFTWQAARRAHRRQPAHAGLWTTLLRWGVHPRILLENHLFLELTKVRTPQEARAALAVRADLDGFVT